MKNPSGEKGWVLRGHGYGPSLLALAIFKRRSNNIDKSVLCKHVCPT